MKTKTLLVTLCLFINAIINSFSQNTYVPDDNFEQALIDLGYDSGELNDSVPTENINQITSLTLSNKGIFDLTGIEDFSALKSLDCVFNQLTEINTLNNINLQRLNCSYNNIISIDLNSNYYLEEFYAFNNQLTYINLQNGNNNNLIINIRNNPNLFCVQVDDPFTAYKNIYWHKDFQTGYTDDCSGISSYMTYVPDDNFEAALIDLGYDSGELNDSVPTLAIKYIKELNITYKGITDLTGIEDFTYLEKLYCANNEIAVIDLSHNTNLVTAFCLDNKIVSLDLSSNQKLTNLTLGSNHLTSINLKNGNNSNMTIDVRGNPDLMCIEVDDPKTSYINTNWQKDLTAIYSIDCSVNPPEMTFVPDDNFEQALINSGYDSGVLNDSVPTMAIRNIEMFYISSNGISDLTGIENFVALRNLYCDRNQISELDLSKNVHLQRLICDYNNLIDLDLSNNYLLNSLHARNNQLTSLNLQNGNNENMNVDILFNPNLFCVQVDNPNETYSYGWWSKSSQVSYSDDCSDFEVQMTYVPDDNFEQALIDLGLDYGELNDSVPTIAIKNLKSLNVSSKNITVLTGIEDFTDLEQLYCSNNQISEINLTANTNLKILQIQNNNITDLDLSSNIQLTQLVCYYNNIIELDLSGISFLTNLNATNNDLTGLNLQNGNNSNMSVDVRYNNDLLCIEVDNPEASYSNVNWVKNAYAAYTEDCSNYTPEMTYVPDDNFEQILINLGLDFGPLNDSVPTIGLKSVTSLNFLNNKSINDLTGIEDFENIEILDISFNDIEFLNLSNNKKLMELKCSYNKLTFLDLQNNINLTRLFCQSNPLVSINLTNNLNLQYLDCSYCQLTNINIQNNDNLETFGALKNPPLCILVNDIDLAKNKTTWYIDDWANYSLDCSNHNVEKIYLPDDNFEKALIDRGFDFKAPDDSVYKAIVETITSLTVYNEKIKSLEGIEFFTSLEELIINNNELSEVDLSHLTNLKVLKCRGNALDSLSLFTNKKLIELDCDENQLNNLNLDSCAELQDLTCRYNNLQNLNLSNNLKLINFSCRNNQITELDISSNIYLEDFSCNFNQITSLNLNQQLNLVHLACNSNKIAELDLTSNTLLRSIYCGYNQLTFLDLSNNSNLFILNCENNNLVSLNLKNGYNQNIYSIYAQNNADLFCIQVDDPVISDYSPYWHIDQQVIFSEDCSQPHDEMTYIPDDNFEKALIELGYDTWPLDDSVMTAKISPISFLSIDSKNISDLTGIEDFIALSGLDCDRNKLNTLNLSNNIALTFLSCDDNQINTLNFNSNSALERLYCQRNQLTELDISNNNNLEILYCNNNQLSWLDLSNNTTLNELYCDDNILTCLNIQNGNNHNLSQFSAKNNSELLCIQVDNSEACESYSNWYKDDWVSYSEDCGYLGAGVPLSEYNTLVDLYNSTNGEEWTNSTNWLDTTNYTVADWHGITVENGHVTQILLNENNLQNSAFEELIYLPKLRRLELADNKLIGFNFLATDSLISLDTLMILNNQLIFDDLAPAFLTLTYPNYSENFYYSPQAKIDVQEYKNLLVGDNFHFEVAEQFLSPNDQFQWYKDLILLDGETNSIIEFSPVTKSDSGTYHLQIVNPEVPGLILSSNYKSIYISEHAEAGVPISEYNALVDFYNSTNGDNWTKNTNWLDTINHEVNDWYGITVENGHVTEIYFGPYEKYNLNGNIPNSIKDLTKLESFVIVTDNLNGELPEGLFELINLKTLYLSECKITGELSSSIGNLINLEILGLEANDLNGPIPNEIGNLSHLISLSLSENNFTGNIPSSIGKLTNLEYLGISQNKLNGRIPSSIGNLSNLEWLLLDKNQIIGPLPVELANLENIIKISIENNRIGFIDSTLKSAAITHNLSGDNRQIPEELATLIQMDTLYLGGNNLQFNDIEAIFSWGNYNDFKDFIYYPQDSLGQSKIIESAVGDTIVLSIENYYPGVSDKYQWYKNGTLLPGETDVILTINNLHSSDKGKYYCKVTNLVADKLILTTRTINLKIDELNGIENYLINDIAIFPNPAQQQIFVDTRNKIANLKIYNISGIVVYEKENFSSDWIDIEKFAPGIYLFKISMESQGAINKKVIFR